MTTERRPMVEATVDGDWHRCGACTSRFALGIAAVREGARVPCKHCGIWNLLPMSAAKE